MSEREDVEALAEVLRNEGFWATHADRWTDVAWQNRFWAALGGAILASSWLATHDEQVRADALAPVRFCVEVACDGYANLTEDDIPGDVFTEDDYMAGAADAANAIRAALPPERLAGS